MVLLCLIALFGAVLFVLYSQSFVSPSTPQQLRPSVMVHTQMANQVVKQANKTMQVRMPLDKGYIAK